MPRISRVDVGGEVYHVLNRANARVQIFDNNNDYQQFEEILEEAVEKFNMRLLAYCIMPNHWHLVLRPRQDGDLQQFMSWLTNTQKIQSDKDISIRVDISHLSVNRITIYSLYYVMSSAMLNVQNW